MAGMRTGLCQSQKQDCDEALCVAEDISAGQEPDAKTDLDQKKPSGPSRGLAVLPAPAA